MAARRESSGTAITMAAQARKCFEQHHRINPDAAKTRLYYEIGTVLLDLSPDDHAGRYGKGQVKAFIRAWNDMDGMQLSETTAKHTKLVAKAFTTSLLDRAVNARLSWSVIRELAAETVSGRARYNYIRHAESKLGQSGHKITVEHVVRYLQQER